MCLLHFSKKHTHASCYNKNNTIFRKKLHQQRKKEQKISLIFLLAIEKQTHFFSYITASTSDSLFAFFLLKKTDINIEKI